MGNLTRFLKFWFSATQGLSSLYFLSYPIVADSLANTMLLQLILGNYLGYMQNLFGDTVTIHYDNHRDLLSLQSTDLTHLIYRVFYV